jgi:hypothetical protein
MADSKKKFGVFFAGAVGSSKTPMAHYLSCKFNLPIFSNDAVRTEVAEDLSAPDQTEYEKRRDKRLAEILEKGYSFIYDASIDRQWGNKHRLLQDRNYKWFIVSLDLSKDFLLKLYKVKGYGDISSDGMERLISDHDNFLRNFGQEVNARITDQNFHDRLEVSAKALARWLKNK